MRDEFSKLTEGRENENLKDVLKDVVQVEKMVELQYLSWIIYEGLRIRPPLPNPAEHVVVKDFSAGGYNFKAGTKFFIYLGGLHHNSEEWQRPDEFIPERFDHTSPLSLTSSGEKRNTFSWAPFLGGKRICFGKTLADANMRTVITYFTQNFDFEFVEPEKYQEKLPEIQYFPIVQRQIKVRLRRRKP